MSRQMYENEATKARERSLAEIVESKWNCELNKVSIKYRVDCLAMRDNTPVSWIELRCRENTKDQYPTLMISLAKVQGAKSLAQDTGLPVLLVVEWTDCVAFVDLANVGFTLGFGGRNQMRDWQDREPVCYIDTKEFTSLTTKEKAA